MRLRILCILFAVCFLASVSTRAQDDPNFEVGLKPFGAYQMGNIDSIGLGNGSLMVHIPLISYPQRGGKLKLSFSLYGASVGAYADEMCYPPPINQCYVMPSTTGTIGVNVINDNSPGTMQIIGSDNLYLMEIIDSTDATHFLGVTGTNLMESVDATGWQAKGSPTSGVTTLTGPDGTVYYNSSCVGCITDANGNQITYSSTSGTYTDTMGRVIPESTSTTNFANCTGSLPVGTAYIWNPPGVNGGTYPVEFCYVGNSPGFDGLLESVVLPNNTAWTFTYALGTTNIYPGLIGDNFTPFQLPFLAQITFPTGGTISYGPAIITPRCITHQWVDDIGIVTRTLNPNDGVTPTSTWTYTYAGGGQTPAGGGTTPTTVVSAPSSGAVPDDSVHSFMGGCFLYETEAQSYQGSHTSGTLLKTVNTSYSYTGLGWVPALLGNVVATNVQTTWANGQTDSVSYTYDSGFQFQNGTGHATGTFGKQVAKKEYDYGGTLLRTTNTNYLALNNSTYESANIIDPVSSVQITDGGGTQRAYTTYGYDATGGVHGNLTSTSRWLSTTGGYLTTSNIYDSYGRVTSTTDPNNNTTTYAYTPSTCPSGSGYAGSGPNSVKNPLLQTTYSCYDLNTGLLTQTTDPNGLATGTTYDQMLRTLAVNEPDDGQTTFCYTDTGSESGGGSCSQSSPPYEVVISEKISSSTNRVSTLQVDGVGREIRQAVTNGETKPYDEVDTCYDGDGRVSFKSYAFQDSGPFATSRTCASPEAGDSFAYDGLSRPTTVTHSDNSVISTSYTGNSATVTDEAAHTRESFADGLGRLEEVIENPGGLGYVTTYGYDALDDLTSVVQNSSRDRTFVYDSLARLTSSTNPEANWSFASQAYVPTTYSYDGDGNLVSKTEPAQNQQASAQVTLSYCYDALNRMTSKAYTLQSCPMSSPVATYSYDQPSCLGQTNCYNIGHRTSMTDAAGTEKWSYEFFANSGWQALDLRTTNSITKRSIYEYNLLGSPISITYPMTARVISYTYNLGNRPVSATDNTTLANYANTVHYWAGGSPCWAAYGTAITAAETYNPRLQPLNMQATGSVIAFPGSCSGLGQTGNLLDLTYNFNYGSGDNGNVMGITNNRDTTRSQSFVYDALNRLLTGETTSTYSTSPAHCWGETYIFDNNASGGAWGNLTNINPASSTYNGCTQETLSVTASAQNQTSSGTYDTAGNLTYISGAGGGTFTFNAENQMTQAATSTTTGYVYDGDGKRVEKTASGTPYKLYWYGVDGSILDETDQTGSPSNSNFSEYVYLGTQRIGRRDYSNNVYYYASDHLGTSRVMAEVPSGSTTATLCYDADFYPFGGERAYTTSCTQNYKFTGKERDSESGLDNSGARFESSSIARFMSPDPSAVDLTDTEDPQQLNLYSYVRNSPLTLIDPDGLDCIYTSNQTSESVTVTIVSGNCASGSTNGTYVNGTVDANSLTYDGTELGYSFSNEADKTGGSGVLSLGPPTDSDYLNAVGLGAQMAGYFLSTPYRWHQAAQAWMERHPNIQAAILIGAALTGGEGPEGEGGGPGNAGEGPAAIPGRPFKGGDAPDQAYQHLEQYHGVDSATASERLHNIKQAAGLGPADNVVIGRTGDVYNPKTGEKIGSLTQSH